MPDTTEPRTARRATVRKREPEAKVLRYTKPPMDAFEGKALVRLAQSDILFSNVQIVKDGGDNNLHSHAGMDGLWFVLKGRARFYGTLDDTLLGELGPHEAIFIPRGFPYWFEKVGDEPLEILQVEALDRSVKNTRTDHKPMKSATAGAYIFSIDGEPLSRGFTNPGLDKPQAGKA